MGSERPARFLAAGSGPHRGRAGGPLFDVASISAAFVQSVFDEVSLPAASRRGPGPGKVSRARLKLWSLIKEEYKYFNFFFSHSICRIKSTRWHVFNYSRGFMGRSNPSGQVRRKFLA